MGNIGGNTTAQFMVKEQSGKNAIGEPVLTWKKVAEQSGWLGLQSGEQKRSTFIAKIEESTHVFLCDYKPEVYALADQDVRAMIKGIMYDVTLIDNPDEMDEQLEIFLRRVGASKDV